MKYFTKAQIEEIRKQLATMGVRDTDLPDVTAPLSGSELVAIVQNGENRKVGIRKLIHDYLPDDIADGADGASAYDVWRSQPGNYNKTVQEFLESLKGEDGAPGINGTDGINGTNGTNGADGRDGVSAGFGTPTASVDTTSSGQVGVSVTASGPDTAKIFNFVFHNLASGGGGGTAPTDTGKVRYSSQATNPGNPDESPNYWHPVRTSYDVWMAFCFLVDGDWSDWTILYIGDIDVPYASFKSFAFTRAASQPEAPTGGNYSNPNPTTTGWYDGIPAGSGAIWMSSRIFASDGTHSDANWSTPRLLADNEFMDYEFSSVANPGVPSKATPSSAETNPNWSNEATEGTIWMAMREISNGAYKAGSSWMVVKIKGEDGKDGTSVNILGSKSSVGELPSTGNVTGDGWLVGGVLYVWDGDSWENCGQIQGPPGADGDTPYIHIKYSNDGGAHFTSNDGEDPGDYIGIYCDYVATDSSNVSSYTWKYWKGEDGFGYEYIFKVTNDNTAPLLPSSSLNEDDYVPTGWTDDPGLDPATADEYRWCWVAWRKKEDGVWSAWHGTTNGRARLYSYSGQDGTDGTNGIDGKDALPIRIRNWSEIGGVTLTGNDKVFSGYENNAPFRDVIVITSDVYPSGVTYPFTIADPLGTGSIGTPVLVVVNYSDSYPNGFSGTDLSLPTSSTYTNSIASNKTESSTLYGQGRVYSVFQNLGAVYARILVATQGYIGSLTVDQLLARDATITETFTAEDIHATGGKIGSLDIDQYGLSADINRATDSYYENADFELNSSNLKYETEFIPKSSGSGAVAGVSAGVQKFSIGDRTEVGFVTISDSTLYPGPTEDCAVFLNAPNKDAARIHGNVFLTGDLHCNGKLFHNMPVESINSSPQELTRAQSGTTFIITGGPNSGTFNLPEVLSDYYEAYKGVYYDFVAASYSTNSYTVYASGNNTITTVVDGNVSLNLNSYTMQNGHVFRAIFCGGSWTIVKIS